MPHPTLHTFVTGRVQGVFFRAHTQQEAERLGLAGWVRNLPDGRVEVYAVGTEEPLKELLDWLHHGPPAAHVGEVEAEWGETTESLDPRFKITG